MRAARYHGKGDLRVVDVEEPQPGPDQALIAVEWGGICGTDLHDYIIGPLAVPKASSPHPLTGGHVPVTMGHEFCGRVRQSPTNSSTTSKLTPGTLVMCDPRIYCRQCKSCQSNHTNLCHKLAFVGLSGGPQGGGFAELVAVDADQCYPIPEHVAANAVVLIEPLAVAHRAVKQAGISDWTDMTVLVLGGGPIGQALIYALRAQSSGKAKILLSEPTTLRREQTGKLADHVIDPISTPDVAAHCRKLTQDHGVDIVFDCAGVQAAANAGSAALCTKGTYVNVAGWEKPPEIPLRDCLLKELRIHFSMAYDDTDFAEVVANFVAGKYEGVESMVTSRIALEDLPEKGFEELVRNRDGHIKILCTPRRENLG